MGLISLGGSQYPGHGFRELAALKLPAPQSGTPMTYMLDGRQYLVIAVSGNDYPGELIAFAVP